MQEHGGSAQYQLEGTVIDFSVNINPYGPSVNMKQAIANCSYHEYPDPNYRNLKKIIAEKYACQLAEIHVGNGAAEIFWTIVRMSGKSQAFMLTPSFSEFPNAVKALNGNVDELPCRPEDQFTVDFHSLGERLRSKHYDLAYFCVPNSPTGMYMDALTLKELALENPKTIFVIDYAFIQFSRHSNDQYYQFPKNVIRVYSLTKEHAIPGIRIGFAISSQDLIQRLNSQVNTWNVNCFAAQAGHTALSDEDFVKESIQQISRDKNYLRRQLDRMGATYFTSDAPYFLIRTVIPADEVVTLLLQKGILVRSCASYGLQDWIRVFPRPLSDSSKLIHFLGTLLENHHDTEY